MSTVATAAVLYSPLILFVVSVVIACKIKLSSETTFTAQPFGIFGISFPLKSMLLARGLAVISAFGFLVLYLFYDYSVLFPNVLQMDVYFDRPGLVRVVNQIFSRTEQAELGLVFADESARQHYFGMLDSEANLVLGQTSFFSVIHGQVHSTGHTTFKVRKITGWQRYQIEESRGELTHTLDAPHIPEDQFVTLFDKLPTSDDYLEPTLWQLFVKGELIIHPRFKQSLAEYRTSKSVSFNIAVIGVTKVYTVPWPHFSSTVYCADLAGSGLLPIAYAIYKQE
jgi:hypothetical protein